MKRRWAVAGAAVLPGLMLGYLALALVFGLIGVNRDFRSTPLAAGGVSIYVRTNGIHADIVVPTRSPDHDWSTWFPAAHMRALTKPEPWIAFGWGDRAFMLETPTWRDVRLVTSLRALAGLGPGAMHVEYLEHLAGYRVAEVQISQAQHRRLIEAIRKSFHRLDASPPVRINAPGYFDSDAFYEALPVYSLRFTCNEWVRTVLSDSGVPVPAWAPFERTLFWHLPKLPAPAQ